MVGMEVFSTEEGKPRAAAGLWGRVTGCSCGIQVSIGKVGAGGGVAGLRRAVMRWGRMLLGGFTE